MKGFEIEPRRQLAVLAICALLFAGARTVRADGANPTATLIQATNRIFYGTAVGGGAYFSGTVYRMTPEGRLNKIYDFTGVADGAGPIGGLVEGKDGNFYGATVGGGANGAGTLYQVTPHGQFTLLHTFGAATGGFPNFFNADGEVAETSLVQGSDGAFYGLAYSGGVNSNGTVFKITATGAFTLLHTFAALDGSSHNSDGAHPQGSLVQSADGALYGTASQGGANGSGTVFKMTQAGTFTTLYSFSATGGSYINSDGAGPYAGLVLGSDGSFYGDADGGGAYGSGTIFKITAAGTLTTLYSFNPATDGYTLIGGIVRAANGDLYGTSYRGGANGSGTVFRYSHRGVFTTLHSFGQDFSTTSDGNSPWAGLVQGQDGKFYGTAEDGGAYYDGTVYSITPTGVLTTLHTFQGSPDGSTPFDSLTLGRDGNLYGTTSSAGANGNGTVFKVLPIGALSTIYSFSATPGSSGGTNADGAAPNAGLVQGPNGLLYGVATAGGANADGTVFSVSPVGAIRPLHSFTGLDGSGPVATLACSRDGTLYGVTQYGGLNGSGTIFKVTPRGAFTSLYSFTALDGSGKNSDGAGPVGGLVLDPHGTLYGTTSDGGAYGSGTVFRLTPTGALTTLYTFTGGGTVGDGADPQGALIRGKDGGLYGTTLYGGAFGQGSVFKITTAGTLTTLYSFDGSIGDGQYPYAGVVQGTDGTLYGTTFSGGGAFSSGTVFSLSLSGNETVLHAFVENNRAYGGVVFGGDGALYGTTADVPGGGTVYRVTTGGIFTTIHTFP